MTCLLVEDGSPRIALPGGIASASYDLRRQGYREALAAAGLPQDPAPTTRAAAPWLNVPSNVFKLWRELATRYEKLALTYGGESSSPRYHPLATPISTARNGGVQRERPEDNAT